MSNIRILSTTPRKIETKPKPFRQMATCQSKGSISPKEKLTPQPINFIEILPGQVWGRNAEQMVVVATNGAFVLMSPLDMVNTGEPAKTYAINTIKFKEKYSLLGG